ncbi:MAG: hypothetical protein WBI63_07735 [Coriobacteriia bacterium]
MAQTLVPRADFGVGNLHHRLDPRDVVLPNDFVESVAEVDYLKRLGGDIIGQSLAPEVPLARGLGAACGCMEFRKPSLLGRAEEVSVP